MLRPTRVLEKEVVKPSPTGLSPSAACFPNTFRLARRFVTSRSPCGETYSKTHNPQRATTAVLTLFRFRLFPFRSPLLRESLRFLFLGLLRCFTSPGSSRFAGDWTAPAGLPHSDISGSRNACFSPELFAACCVLHRLMAPRHPPCALSTFSSFFFYFLYSLSMSMEIYL